ncbi:MAG: hypothetical protein ABI411_19595 [Tahibacter sp.]
MTENKVSKSSTVGSTLRPTVVKAPDARTRTGKKASVPAPGTALPVATPTVVPGVKRERLAVTAESLRALSPGVPAPVCEVALRRVREIVVAKLNDRKVVLWGHDLQKLYSDRVTQTFALTQDPIVEQARAYVARMTGILSTIDLPTACGRGKRGVLESFTKAMSKRIDTPQKLSAALDELRLLLDRTAASFDRLLALKELLQRHTDTIRQIEVDVEAAALAARYLSERFSREAPPLARRFAERSASLAATLAQVRQGDTMHRLQTEQPLRLIAAIQNVALVTLPGCIAGMAALLSLAPGRDVSPTESIDLSYQLRELVDQLNHQESPCRNASRSI